MDRVTQQNASLVEQVSAAASALERQTEELTLSVAKFRLSATEPAVKSAALKSPARAASLSPVLAKSPAAGADDWVAF